MRILALTRYNSLGASSRLRLYQYLPHLQSSGIDIDVRPLFDEGYLSKLYKHGSRSPLKVIKAYILRFFILLTSMRYDCIWVEKELFPYLPYAFEKCLLKKPYFIDIDDAIFHNYDTGMKKYLLGQKISRLMQGAKVVLAGSPYLENYAKQAGAETVLLPTVVDEKSIKPVQKDTNDKLIITWIGTDVTSKYLKNIEASLKEVVSDGGELRLIGATRNPLSCAATLVPWHVDTEYVELAKADIGIMPLPDEPWERGKCGYKLIQYMACGLPVIASPVGVNVDLVESEVNGFLCQSNEQWRDAFQKLKDKKQREKLGKNGRKKVEQVYSLKKTSKQLVDILKRL